MIFPLPLSLSPLPPPLQTNCLTKWSIVLKVYACSTFYQQLRSALAKFPLVGGPHFLLGHYTRQTQLRTDIKAGWTSSCILATGGQVHRVLKLGILMYLWWAASQPLPPNSSCYKGLLIYFDTVFRVHLPQDTHLPSTTNHLFCALLCLPHTRGAPCPLRTGHFTVQP